ncbi:MAG TPA: secretin N-terminal domain-containing protein [Lacipirellulaceae bacterium]|jgi:type II secretory pathway component GspD/PulD (secretin)
MRSVAAAALRCAALLAALLATPARGQQPDDGTQFKAYVLHQTDAESARQQLTQFFAATPGVETVADAPRNRVLVRGNPQVLQLADQFIAKLDQPPVNGPAAAAAAAPQQQLEAYQLTPASREVLAALQTQAAGRTDVRVAIDQRSSQALVLAPPAIHAQLRTQLAQTLTPAAGNTNPQPTASAITLNGVAPPVATLPTGMATNAAPLRLHHLPADQLRGRLEQLLSRPLTVSTDVTGQWQSFLVEAAPGASVTVSVNPATSELQLAGPAARAAAWRTVIEALDAGPATPGAVTRLVSTKPASQDRVRQVLQVVQSQATEQPHSAESLVSMMLQPRDAVSGLLAAAPATSPSSSAPAPVPTTPARSAAERAFSEAPPAANATNPAGGSSADSAAKAIDLANAAGELLGPVQIEFVEGLDVIVLRGNERDVQRVMEIINQIEQLSAVTVPTIEVYQLQNVDSRALGALLTRLYAQVLAQRIGDVSITPLGKPNALLLVGRAENVRMAKELIQQLDQPVAPATRFEVFPLKHASADDAKKLIDNFLQQNQPAQGPGQGPAAQEAPTLAPRAMVVADYRTNSLIVSAGPRDITEIAALVARIDAPSGEAVDQVRVFTLRNAVASELAGVLRDAIQGQSESTTSQSGTGGNTGGQSGSNSSSSSTSSSSGRASALEFRQIGAGLQQAFTSGVLTGARISADARANSIIVTAPADSMELIAALIDQLDQVPNAAAELKVFTIVNGDATSLTDMLRTLFNASSSNQQSSETGGLGEQGLVRMQFSVDQRTNSIIAAGTRDDLAVVEAILLRLDLGDIRERVTTVYKLKNAFANDVATALNNWLQTERTAEQNAQLAISPFEQIDREVVIVPELASNSLVVSATPRYYKDVKSLIEQLDERPPMVLIQVMIAEVQLNNTDEFGIQLGLQDSVLFDRSLLTDVITNTTTTTQTAASTVSNTDVISATQNPGFNFNNQALGNNGSTTALANAAKVGTQALSDFSLGRVNNDLGFGGFVFSASSNSVNVLLRALQEKRRLEVLSRPQIMALDGQTGLVQVGQRVPRITATSLTQFGQTNSIVYEPVGIILQVTPRISPDGLVVMQIGAEKSEVGAEAEGIPISVSASGQIVRAPRINATTAFTTVSALSDQTVVLSGLLTSRQFDIHRQVPLLGDIPLIGDLFRYDAVNKQRTELLIILTPKIVYNKLDSDVQKQIESSRMSWCVSDVVKLHGDAGLRSRCDQWNDNETEAVYPTYIPKEGEMLPAGPDQGAPMQGPTLQPPPRPSPPHQLPSGGAQPMPTPPQQPVQPPMTMSGQPQQGVVPAQFQYDGGTPQPVNQASYTTQPTRLPPSR